MVAADGLMWETTFWLELKTEACRCRRTAELCQKSPQSDTRRHKRKNRSVCPSQSLTGLEVKLTRHFWVWPGWELPWCALSWKGIPRCIWGSPSRRAHRKCPSPPARRQIDRQTESERRPGGQTGWRQTRESTGAGRLARVRLFSGQQWASGRFFF